jgi:hypothetical protein
VPLSGRLLAGPGNIGVPYLLPFGDPGGWASIPQRHHGHVSRFCLQQTISLFKAIEEASGRTVQCCDLGRAVFGLPRDDTRYVTALECLL